MHEETAIQKEGAWLAGSDPSILSPKVTSAGFQGCVGTSASFLDPKDWPGVADASATTHLQLEQAVHGIPLAPTGCPAPTADHATPRKNWRAGRDSNPRPPGSKNPKRRKGGKKKA